jgi:hypothetical protein
LAEDGTNTVTVAPGSNVHWSYGSTHAVVETDASGAVKAGGFSSGAVGAFASYTHNVGTTEGTIYFKCANAAHPTMTGTIIVTSGGGGAAAGVTASAFVALGAVVAALIAAKRF